MTNKVYSITEIVGSSDQSVDDAIRVALKTASASLRNLDWFQVKELRGSIKDGAPGEFQVTLKIGFRYDKS